MMHTVDPSRDGVILLVEDRKMDVQLALDAFRKAGVENEIKVVTSGDDALDYFYGLGKYSDRSEYPLPNLVLLDLSLPGINGHEVLEEVKATPYLRRIPVIVLTSSQEHFDLEKCYDVGVNSYLVKPVSFAVFCNVVRDVSKYWLGLNVEPPMRR